VTTDMPGLTQSK